MIWIAVGSNLQPHVHVPSAIERLLREFGQVECSPFYETQPIDRPEQPAYWNGVVGIRSQLPRGVIEARLRGIEEAEGRVRTSDKWAARTLDLDIIGQDRRFVDEVQQRPFLLRCLADIDALPPDIDVPKATWPVVWETKA